MVEEGGYGSTTNDFVADTSQDRAGNSPQNFTTPGELMRSNLAWSGTAYTS